MKLYDVPQAVGSRILVEVEMDTEHAIKSDILVIPDAASDTNKRCLQSTSYGNILQMGQAAVETGILTKCAEELVPGDIVLFLQNAGVSFKHAEEDKLYRLISRGDIMAKVGVA